MRVGAQVAVVVLHDDDLTVSDQPAANVHDPPVQRGPHLARALVTPLGILPQAALDRRGIGIGRYPVRGVERLQAGSLFVADCDNHAVRKVDLDTASVSTLAGSAEKLGSCTMRRPEYTELHKADMPAMWYGGTLTSVAASETKTLRFRATIN